MEISGKAAVVIQESEDIRSERIADNPIAIQDKTRRYPS
jgi:hypothetical protein